MRVALQLVDEQIAATTRRAEALERAQEQAEDEMAALVEQNRADWTAEQKQRIQQSEEALEGPRSAPLPDRLQRKLGEPDVGGCGAAPFVVSKAEIFPAPGSFPRVKTGL